MTIEEKVQKRWSEIISECLEARLHGIYMTPISIREIRKDEIIKAKAAKTIVIAKELESFVEIFKEAQRLYAEKGFAVELVLDGKTGLISKWILKNRFPKHLKVDSGKPKPIVAVKTLHYQEFISILVRLGDHEFSSRDIMNALIGSGIGLRKLQPTLGLILKGMHGKSPIEKVPGVEIGPGVRYRKVK
jgi:hypothetical protein